MLKPSDARTQIPGITMKRMTAQFKILNTWVGVEATQNICASIFIKSLPLTHTTLFKQVSTDMLFVELNSESTQNKLAPMLKNVAQAANLEFVTIGWGWIISDRIYNIYSQELINVDNFKARRYIATPALIVYNALLLILFISLAALALKNLVDNPAAVTPWMGFVFACAFVFAGLFQVREIIYGRDDLVIKYWFPYQRAIAWDNIISMQVRMMRSLTCTIKMRKGWGVDFQVGKYLGIGDAESLVKTIAQKSKLHLVEGYYWENSQYIQYNG
jgi:hypothetical protein